MAEKNFVADKLTLDMIKNNIGYTDDSAGTATGGTLMAKSNAILTGTNTLKNNQTGLHNDLQSLAIQIIGADPTATGGSTTTGNVIAKENAILANIGATDDTWTTSSGTDGTLMAKINRLIYRIGDPDDTIDNGTVLGRVSSGIIRNYQSGVVTSLPTKIILEGFTDINKMLIILDGGEIRIGVISNTRYGVFSPVIWSTYSNTTLQLASLELGATSETARDTYVSYQVIEFY